jgi:hypothetical protein
VSAIDNLTMVDRLRDAIDDHSVYFGLREEIPELGRSFASLFFSFI